MNTKKPTNGSPKNETNWVTLADFETLCFDLAQELLGHFEYIPPFTKADLGRLESSLSTPRQTFGGKLLYPTLKSQSAALFYFLIKNHPFENGNKRIALTTLLVFLNINRKWLRTTAYNLYLIAIDVAQSDPRNNNQILRDLEEFIDKNLIESPVQSNE